MFGGDFEDQADSPLQFGAHRLIEHNQGFRRSHWKSLSGDYLHRIAPASSAMVIGGGEQQKLASD